MLRRGWIALALLCACEGGQERGLVRVHLSGVFEPASLDFGDVPVNGSKSMRATLVNTGEVTLADLPAITPDDRFTLAMESAVAPGSRGDVVVSFAPSDLGPAEAILALRPAGEDPIELAVTGNGVPAPILAVEPPAVDFGGAVRGSSLSIEVRCIASGPLRFLGAERTGSDLFSWETPGATDLVKGDELRIRATFVASGPQADHTGAIAIRYQTNEGERTLEVPLSARVLAPEPSSTAISIFLFWDSELTDMDLHLIHDGSDCYFQQPTADWGTSGDASDDPFLDRDDFDGIGPENINVASAEPGTYDVYVHYYADNRSGPSIATLELHGGGATIGVFERTLSCDDMWHAGTIVWDGTIASFVESTEVMPADRGLCF